MTMRPMARLVDSYRTRLLVGYLLVVALFSGVWLWSLYGPLTDAVTRQQEGNLKAVAQAGALVVGQSGETADQIARQLVSRTDLRLTMIATDGTVLTDSRYDKSGMENHGNRPEVREALAGDTGVSRRYSTTEGEENLYVAVPTSLQGERIALRVSQPLSEIQAIAANSRRIAMVSMLVAILLASVIAMWAARAAVEPIAALSAAAKKMAAGDLRSEVPAVPSELAPLADSLVTLRSQISQRIEALESEKQSLSATIDGLPDAVLVIEQDKVALTNKAARRLLRTPAGGWKGATVDDSWLPEPIVALIADHRPEDNGEQTTTDPDPAGHSYRVSVSTLEPDFDRTIVVITDVTERSKVDRMRRDFVANASHELKTPASGIRLLAQAVESAASDGDIEQALVFARQIDAEAERLQHLVMDLLDLSRLEAAETETAIADMRKMIDLALTSHRGAAERKGLVLEADLSSVRGKDVFVAMDPTDTTIALDNLIDNAIAYTDEGSVRIVLEASELAVSLRVIDTGVGISAEHLPRVFERFYRVDRGRSRESGGTGLGLALVRHVVERSGGTVTLNSTVGEGTEFTLRLPRAL